MKKALLLSGLLLLLTASASAQQRVVDAIDALLSDPMENRASIGFQLNQYQNDFGAGLSLTSPYLANNKLAFRLRGNVMFLQHPEGSSTTWTPYGNVTAGLIGVSGTIRNFIRLYGEGGFIGLFPSDTFSSESFEFGGYGLFGFEFYMTPRNNYFIEIGGVGSGSSADRLPAAPIYSNGLLISTGFRVHL